ncbi:hypothetical protein [Micromonospora sp. MH33]|uniref:hypothetical protein n=1 Tax=Micromonospora sp. MH33 TaxID=1945509 RepID=UPI00143D3AFA|nr:hypothetical protein [Micromonospora sp. MH33]
MFDAVGVLVLGHEAGDRADAGVEGFTSAVVAAQNPPVLQVSDGMLDADALGGVLFADRLVRGDDARWQ